VTATTQQSEGRLHWQPVKAAKPANAWTLFECSHCGLSQKQHINRFFCPEWRLRQLDGDR
jgi:hypothetical protein